MSEEKKCLKCGSEEIVVLKRESESSGGDDQLYVPYECYECDHVGNMTYGYFETTEQKGLKNETKRIMSQKGFRSQLFGRTEKLELEIENPLFGHTYQIKWYPPAENECKDVFGKP